jgi:hypothetical protein
MGRSAARPDATAMKSPAIAPMMVAKKIRPPRPQMKAHRKHQAIHAMRAPLVRRGGYP